MARLISSSILSLDGYTVDASGRFDWSAPDEEVHAFVNELQRPIGTYLYGRRMYEVMSFWQTMDADGEPEVMTDFAHTWRSADKIVYSSTLAAPTTPRTRIVSTFDADEVRELKRTADDDISIGGPTLAAAAISAGLVDEYQLFVSPIAVGGGTRFFPDGVRANLTLADEHRFTGGSVYLRYLAS